MPDAALPARVLLATDLSARSDRALDRAVQLALQWQAGLVALHVLEAALPDQVLAWVAREGQDDAAVVARRQLLQDIGPQSLDLSVQVAPPGDVARIACDVARGQGCGLLVVGVARNEALGRFLLGSTAERLARLSSEPMLVVRERCRAPYGRIVVATDFSPASAHAVRTAARLFPGQELLLFHASGTPLPSDRHGDDVSARQSAAHEEAQEEFTRFVAGLGLPDPVRVGTRVQPGSLEGALTRHVRENASDLVVIGNRGRSGLLGTLLGSTAERMLDWLPCDTLLVRAP
jgi:nucleotide-binding universal stress UspA family protein